MKHFNLQDKRACPAKPWRSGGFTLLEALVAISILMVAVVAPITIAQKGLSSAVYTKNQMIASYLAQDAIEYIKNKRDEFAKGRGLDDREWTGFKNFFADCMNSNFCAIDTNDNLGEGTVVVNTGDTLKITDGFYGYTAGGKETNFTRKIQIIETDPNLVEASIQVIVSWGDSDGDIDVTAWIYNY